MERTPSPSQPPPGPIPSKLASSEFFFLIFFLYNLPQGDGRGKEHRGWRDDYNPLASEFLLGNSGSQWGSDTPLPQASIPWTAPTKLCGIEKLWNRSSMSSFSRWVNVFRMHFRCMGRIICILEKENKSIGKLANWLKGSGSALLVY